jgi:hypothetical protein
VSKDLFPKRTQRGLLKACGQAWCHLLAAAANRFWVAAQVPSSVRGLLISLKEALICVGVLSGYSLGYLTAEQARTRARPRLQLGFAGFRPEPRDASTSWGWVRCRWKTHLGAAAGAAQVGGWRTIFGAALFPAIALGAGMVRFAGLLNCIHRYSNF